jgi:hypothetical protein
VQPGASLVCRWQPVLFHVGLRNRCFTKHNKSDGWRVGCCCRPRCAILVHAIWLRYRTENERRLGSSLLGAGVLAILQSFQYDLFNESTLTAPWRRVAIRSCCGDRMSSADQGADEWAYGSGPNIFCRTERSIGYRTGLRPNKSSCCNAVGKVPTGGALHAGNEVSRLCVVLFRIFGL